MREDSPYARASVERIISEIKADGVMMSGRAVLDEVRKPRWEVARTAHDWRRYIPDSVRRDWELLPLVTRLRVFEIAALVAAEEEVGAPMVSGPMENDTGR